MLASRSWTHRPAVLSGGTTVRLITLGEFHHCDGSFRLLCPALEIASYSLPRCLAAVPTAVQYGPENVGQAKACQAAEGSDSPDCSASRSAIARDVRSRSTIAAITPHTTAMSNAIHEKRVSQRSAAIPA